jgi:hypothetical protein
MKNQNPMTFHFDITRVPFDALGYCQCGLEREKALKFSCCLSSVEFRCEPSDQVRVEFRLSQVIRFVWNFVAIQVIRFVWNFVTSQVIWFVWNFFTSQVIRFVWNFFAGQVITFLSICNKDAQ